MNSANLNLDTCLNILENSNYHNISLGCTLQDAKKKIQDFSNWLNSIGRLPLLYSTNTKNEEILYLLIGLKKSIKWALSGIGKTNSRTTLSYYCNYCHENIETDQNLNIWNSLQDHSHFEEQYVDFLIGDLNDDDVNSAVSEESEEEIDEIIFQLGDKFGSDVPEYEAAYKRYCMILQKRAKLNEGRESPLNDFRFNFSPPYDITVENTFYPESLLAAVRKVHKNEEYYTVLKSGKNRAICLICNCNIERTLGKSRMPVKKFLITDHVNGKQHRSALTNNLLIMALEKYHEGWKNLAEQNYQAHQNYFLPDKSLTTQCTLCNEFVKYRKLKEHIDTENHKLKVLGNVKENSSLYSLLELQVQVYGVSLEAVIIRPEAVKNGLTKVKETKSESVGSTSTDSGESPKHNIIKAVDNISDKNILKLLPNRFKENLAFLKKVGNCIKCKACKKNILDTMHELKKHLLSNEHIQLSKIQQKKYNYYCEICNVRLLDEVTWDGHFTQGPNKHANIAFSRKDMVTEYECTICATVIYGDELSLTRHLSTAGRKDNKKKEIILPDQVKKLFKSKQCIDSEGNRLTSEAREVLRDTERTAACCTQLETTLSKVFPNCKAYPFGSRVSGLGNQNSDLDIFVDVGDMYRGDKRQDVSSQFDIVRKAAKVFRGAKGKFANVFDIPLARTPIVRVFHIDTELDCDLSFRHGLSFENTKFLRFSMELQPLCQPFILMLKRWSQHCNFNEFISTYALSIMAIFYMQTQNLLLSIKKLRELNPKKSMIIDGWNTIEYTARIEDAKKHVTKYNGNLKDLLTGFFKFYATFDYPADVVCPLLGHIVKKSLFYEDPTGEKLPPEMRSYVLRLKSSEDPEQFRALPPFCIQDPFDLSHNLTKACQSGTINKLKVLCGLSSKHLEAVN